MTKGGGFKASDFMPRYGPEAKPEPLTPEELRDKMMRITAMMGGTVRG
jgi:hypothetical protein